MINPNANQDYQTYLALMNPTLTGNDALDIIILALAASGFGCFVWYLIIEGRGPH